jgi:triphosphoribosyl-dephospho-CoA synthase
VAAVNVTSSRIPGAVPPSTAATIGRIAVTCLKLEVKTWPKPGLVSHLDAGAHHDMDAALLDASAETLRPFFVALAEAGRASAAMDDLRAIGIEAERAMLATTGGVNTHRGAIFGLGLLCAAAGLRAGSTAPFAASVSLGSVVVARWGDEILRGPVSPDSHGSEVARRHGAGGARIEAATGFPSLYERALPALATGRRLAPDDAEAARVHAFMALLSVVTDVNLLYRGGEEGLTFAWTCAQRFLARGGVGTPGWRSEAARIHRAFIERHLSPGGCADLLAMSLFLERVGP